MFNKIFNAIKEGTFFEKVKHVFCVNFLSFYRKLVRKSVKIDKKQIIFIK